MSLDYIRKYYNVPAVLGRRVVVGGRPGVIAEDHHSPYIYVAFDEQPDAMPQPCHPTSQVEYQGMGRVPKVSRSKARYRKYLEVADCYESFADFLHDPKAGAA